MNKYITYEISETANNKVNHQKLYLEFSASTVPVESSEGMKGKIFLEVSEYPNESQLVLMDEIIANHDGEEAEAYDEKYIHKRELQIRELNQLAIFHPVLDNSVLVEYLTSIDNWINAYIRSGINTVLISKILLDSQVGQPFHDFLNQIVNEHGNKTYEYFITKVS